MAVTANDLVINGNTVDLTGDVTINDVIGSINQVAADSGVQALKATSVATAAAGLSAAADGTASINGVTISLTATATGGSGALNIAAINAVSNQTGVTASAGTGEAVVLSNSSGADIVIADGTTTFGGGPGTFSAGIVLAGAVADGAFTAAGTFAVEAASTALGGVQADNTLSGVDVLTGATANDALLTLDFALQQVSGLRAELGAVQTRFESTISNLSINTENLSAARSRIRDADFAAETAELTRSQILQQAGISILSQANAQPQNVLALLQ